MVFAIEWVLVEVCTWVVIFIGSNSMLTDGIMMMDSVWSISISSHLYVEYIK
ncbi:hypothetical protein MTsN2n4_27800 [Pseudoalteromonas sp. MTN2-4]